MNNLTSQQRKFVYLGAILLLLIPIIWLGMPADGTPNSGGSIARLRQKYDLGESDLGRLDPSGAAMNLALLGLRGVAANILWMKCEEQKNQKDWPELRVTTDSIIRLQPHFEKVWEYNGWNLAYNVSAEWDAVPDRYFWVKEGGKFLQRGVERNRRSSALRWHVGRVYGPKIGLSDEARYFRRYFYQDPDPQFNKSADPEFNVTNEDNYLVSKRWFQQANDAEANGVRQTIMDRSIFRSYPARSQLDYAAVLYKYGFREEYDREVGDRKLTDEEAKALEIRVREKLKEQTRAAWVVGLDDWTRRYGQELFSVEYLPGVIVQMRLEMSEDELKSLGKTPEGIAQLRRAVDQYQKMNNYRYWRTRALCESETDTAEAHWALFAAGEEYLKQNTSEAQAFAETSMTLFEKTLQKYPELRDEDNFVEEALKAVLIWTKVLSLRGVKPPDTFALKSLWDEKQALMPEIERRFERDSRSNN